MLRYCFFLSLLIFCLPSLFAQDDDLPLTELDDLFQEFDRPDAPGLTVAIRYRGKTVYERAYGLADLETHRKNTTDTPMAAGEFSGQMTAFALLLLEEDGKLQLSDPLVQYLPELGEAVAGVTLGHLLSRTHGLIDQIFAQAIQGRNRQATTSADLLRLYARQPGPGHPPGTEFTASYSALWLVAEVVARVSEQSLAEFCHQRIFEPLDMPNTFFAEPGVGLPSITAKPYRESENVFQLAAPVTHAPGPVGLYTSVNDWLRWEAHLEAPLQSVRATEKLAQIVRLDNGHPHHQPEGELTYGQDHRSYERGIPEYYLFGQRGGFASSLFRFRDQSLSVAILSNNGLGYNGYLGNRSSYLFLEPFFTEAAEVDFTGVEKYPVNDAEMQSYAGHYWDNQSSLSREVIHERDSLFYQGRGGAIYLFPLGPGRFQMDMPYDDLVFLEFSTGPEGKRMHYVHNGSDPILFTGYTPMTPTEEDSREYLGTYYAPALSVGYEFTLTEAGTLVARSASTEDVTFTPYSADRFYGSRTPWWNVEFQRDAAGKISGFHLNVDGLRQQLFQKIMPKARLEE